MVCSLLQWMKGRNHSRSARPVDLYRLGGVSAELHHHADRWRGRAIAGGVPARPLAHMLTCLQRRRM